MKIIVGLVGPCMGIRRELWGGGERGIIREENMCFRTCIRVITIRGEKLVTKDKGGGVKV